MWIPRFFSGEEKRKILGKKLGIRFQFGYSFNFIEIISFLHWIRKERFGEIFNDNEGGIYKHQC